MLHKSETTFLATAQLDTYLHKTGVTVVVTVPISHLKSTSECYALPTLPLENYMRS